MTRYILIDAASGFIFGDTAGQDFGPHGDEAMTAAARWTDATQAGSHGRDYEVVSRLGGRPGYIVYRAADSFPEVEDGQDDDTISAVDRDCDIVGYVAVKEAAE